MITPAPARIGKQGGRVELGQVQYNKRDRRWERWDGEGWAVITAEPASTGTEIFVYESTDNGG
jgi:hypothetical protein